MSTDKKAFWIENLRAARALMERTDPDNVDLSTWRQESHDGDLELRTPTCGTIACFGGWISLDPYFQSLGVAPDKDGAPFLESGGHYICAFNVAIHLFGDDDLFNPSFSGEKYDRLPDGSLDTSKRGRTDHQIVLNRIDARLALLEA